MISSFAIFGLELLIIRSFEFLEDSLTVIAGFGMVASVLMVITGNVRLIRYIFVIRKENTEVLVWKSAISIAFGLTSLVVYWFILLILVFQSF